MSVMHRYNEKTKNEKLKLNFISRFYYHGEEGIGTSHSLQPYDDDDMYVEKVDLQITRFIE